MDINKQISLQIMASIFGDFSNYNATPDLITDMLSKLHSYKVLPNTVSAFKFDIKEQTVKTSDKPQFVSKPNNITINIFDDRIDVVNISPIESEVPFYKMNEYIKLQYEAIGSVLEILNETGNRIAFNEEILCKICSLENLGVIRNNTINFIEYYNSNELKEWSIRFNKLDEFKIDDTVEICNVITNFQFVDFKHPILNQAQENYRLVIHFDINTLGENQKKRFGKESARKFFEFIENRRENLLKQIAGQIK